ncbi:uncharacterized protein MCYG_07530 [Microsporum canis CBS 113480]|uniref:Uncharacterized protein n=1 Tax=Arthroderma otae (strain ATCC MYA-4605 / CBS 113480) TaxID=554155 RepID=C5FYW3_ARTOC|nr:uncharacterized protein MCYG_07530 [Microsporum canis CBS 113480]EEQ34711.1 predicted protein [Microsporum canis CBS 113480]
MAVFNASRKSTEAMHALEVLLAMFFKNFEDLRGRYTGSNLISFQAIAPIVPLVDNRKPFSRRSVFVGFSFSYATDVYTDAALDHSSLHGIKVTRSHDHKNRLDSMHGR